MKREKPGGKRPPVPDLSMRACFAKSLPCLHRREDTTVADFSVDERKLDAWCAWYAFTCEKLELKMLDEQRLRMGMSPPGMPSPFGMASRMARRGVAPPMDGLPRPETRGGVIAPGQRELQRAVALQEQQPRPEQPPSSATQPPSPPGGFQPSRPPPPARGMGFGNFSSRSGGPMGGEQPLPRHLAC